MPPDELRFEWESPLATIESPGQPERGIDVGVLVAHTPAEEPADLGAFATGMVDLASDELGSATASGWRFYAEDPTPLADGRTRYPAEFLDRAIHRMVDGPYDLVVVVTDAPLVSRRERFVPGLASPLGRTVVISTRVLRRESKEGPRWPLDSDPIRVNAATLLLHLIGHVLGARHRSDDGAVMAPFEFDPGRGTVPRFSTDVEGYLRRIATTVPQAETVGRDSVRRLVFYTRSAVRNREVLLRSLVNSRAPLLPLSLPKLTTAAVAPTLVIVFSAEAWDVGFHMSDGTAVLFALGSIAAAAGYLLFAQRLLFPRERHRVITEHTALVNVTISITLVLAMVGLFVFVGAVILLIELVVFPPNLMANWPSLEDPAVGPADLVRTGMFISTIGVLSGALAGGLESRTIVRHLTLFLDRP